MNRKIFYGASGGFFFTGVTAFVAVVQLRWILHYLPKQTAGIWILFLTLGSYITFFDLGISPTLGREISFLIGRKTLVEHDKQQQISQLISTCNSIFKVIAISLFAISLAAGAAFIKNQVHYQSPELFWSWAIFSFGATLNLLGSTAFAALFGIGNVATEKLLRSAALLVGLALTWFSLRAGFGLLGLAAAWTAQGFLARALAWRVLRRHLPASGLTHEKVDWRLATSIAIPSLKFAGVQLGAILILQTANVVIASKMGASFIPSYEAVSKIATTLMTVSMLVVLSSTPFLSRYFASGEVGMIRSLLQKNLRFAMALLLFFVSFAAIFGNDIVRIWLGPNIFPGRAVLWTLLLMVTLEVHHVIYASAMMATGNIAFVATALIAGVLTLLLAYSLVGHYGLWGVSLAVLVAQLCTNNWYAPFITFKFFQMEIGPLVREVYLPLFSFATLQLLTIQLLHHWLAAPSSGLRFLVTSFLTSLVIGLFAFFVLVLDQTEKRYIANVLSPWVKRGVSAGPAP